MILLIVLHILVYTLGAILLIFFAACLLVMLGRKAIEWEKQWWGDDVINTTIEVVIWMKENTPELATKLFRGRVLPTIYIRMLMYKVRKELV